MKKYRVGVVFEGAVMSFFIASVDAESEDEAREKGRESATRKYQNKKISKISVEELH